MEKHHPPLGLLPGYRAITTRIRTQEINFRGDGICQVSESCGTRNSPDKCIDCGLCT